MTAVAAGWAARWPGWGCGTPLAIICQALVVTTSAVITVTASRARHRMPFASGSQTQA